MNNEEYDSIMASTWNNEKMRLLEEINAFIVISGGSAKDKDQLREMEVGRLIDLIWPNGIRLKVEHIHFKQ